MFNSVVTKSNQYVFLRIDISIFYLTYYSFKYILFNLLLGKDLRQIPALLPVCTDIIHNKSKSKLKWQNIYATLKMLKYLTKFTPF